MLLDRLDLPSDLKKLSGPELDELAKDIRTVIIDTVSRNGGHLSSNLGSVELSIALHTIFDSPSDKIIWDVGHQSYAHKILTGRLKQFGTLRLYDGISGYPSSEESEHDQFTTGHASTAISSAIGLAKARDLLGKDYKVVAAIGDGSLSGGLSLEAINNAMNLKSNLVIILNDNEMSISKNVGALAEYFTKVRMNPIYTKTKARVEKLVKKIPKIGMPMFKIAEKLKNRMKNFIINFQTEVIVEEFGIQYLGPIDGHNITLLMSALSFAKEVQRPILLHILTKKGKGYPPAEKNPTKFHGVAAFDVKTGEPLVKSLPATYTEIFGKTVLRLGLKDPNIVAVTAAMVEGTGLDEFAKAYPDRFYDVGIAEEHSVIFAAGLAKGGMVPVCAIYSTFLQRSYDQIFHDVCLQNLHVVFCMDRAGVVGDDGPTHNGVFDLAYMRHLPNMVVMAPKDENELQHMIFTAINHDGPISLRYPKTKITGVKMDGELKKIEIGKGEIVYKSEIRNPKSETILIISIGSMVHPSIEAAKMLEKDAVSATVINSRFVKPLDRDLIVKEAKEAGQIVTVEEGCLQGGFGSAVLELLEEEKIIKPVKRIGLPDKFIEAGKRDFILEKYGLYSQGIAGTIRRSQA
ncbi:MAG: 1-deoxy-D-xylulose-5-phosphate synthase [Candidatus Saganbacteria bacterium]|nr:1-deoxy-D-xylulose-5-phosphate synthase [Candidatus Saganbacteria bacterium]